MEERLFTFFGIISHEPAFILLSHTALAFALTIVLAFIATKKLKTVPTGLQNIFEVFLEGIISMCKDVLGEDNYKKYIPLVATIGLFVFSANFIGIIPGFESPTGNINFTLSLALIVFVYYNYEGIRANGVVAYFAHFLGPVKILAPLMFPIEIISHLSRIISLSFRLFGNIKGDDLFLIVLLMLAPYFIPLPAFALLSFMAILQAFIFMMLTIVYISSATIIEEGH
jgi:F-type H+-transporting ATPase subunit a